MVEVTEEEYEKIKGGILAESIPTYEQVREEVFENLSAEDAALLLDKHLGIILHNIVDRDLIAEIMLRTKRNGKPLKTMVVRDPISIRDYTIIQGELSNINKVEREKADEPVVETDDIFSWTLKTYELI